jgi:hypothetical protein
LKGDAFRGLDLLLGVVAPALDHAITFACAVVGVSDGKFNESFLRIGVRVRVRVRVDHDDSVVGVFRSGTPGDSYRNRQTEQDQQSFHGNHFLSFPYWFYHGREEERVGLVCRACRWPSPFTAGV